ncbi:LPP20 family lipoprotein [Desulfonatronum sp. SC1]|uniref:LPP20 family lipoprotein n=1 Tax=Desulfonatronum sp. SC1 TaxID=2109626 RepID=UPI001304851C|nr:LPP20 family lipoprotein [Desulfonatronum sp. SC1]
MSKVLRLSFLLCMALVLVGCYIVPAQQPDPTPAPPPPPRWEPITLRANGQGAPPERAINPAQARMMTERAAKLDGYRNLLEQAYGVNISAQSNVRNFVLQNDTVRSRVDAYIRGARVVDTIYHDDGGVEVLMEITLGDDFRRMFPR